MSVTSRVVPIHRHELPSLIEAVLYHAGRPVTATYLADVAGASEGEVRQVLDVLRSRKGDDRGICVSWDGHHASLVVNPRYEALIRLTDHSYVDHSIALIEEYLSVQRQRGRRPRTIESYRLFLTRFARELGKPVDEATTRDIRRFLMREESERGNVQSTVTRKIHILSSLYKWLHREEIIERDPMARIDAPTDEEAPPKFLTVEELERVRDVCRSFMDRLLVELLYSSGVRVSEAVAIDWSDIDWEGKRVLVRDGKGGKSRIVPLSTRAVMLLREHRRRRQDDSPWLLQSQFRQRMSVAAIQSRMRKIGERAGLAERLTPHRLRHTLATHLLAGGTPIHVVQEILGHSSVRTTQVYARTQMEQVEMYYRRVIP